MRTDFGQRLYDSRRKACLTQAQLAKAVGISQAAVAEMEKIGRGSAYVIDLARACNIDPGWLATGVSADRPEPVVSSAMSAGAIELAALYDLIPTDDRIGRAQAYSNASAAILAVLHKRHATEQADQRPEKQSD